LFTEQDQPAPVGNTLQGKKVEEDIYHPSEGSEEEREEETMAKSPQEHRSAAKWLPSRHFSE
jgi:hypothetical protein